MKVILNVDGITTPLTGIGNYTYQLAKGLEQNVQISDVKLYSSHRWIKDADAALTANKNLSKIRNNIPFKSTALKLYMWQKNLLFKQKSKALSDDYIFHSPNFLLMPYAGASVVTVHDLSYIRYPETHPPERIEILQKQLPKSLAQADAIITVSEFVKQELQQLMGIDKDKIHAVALGVSARFKPYKVVENQAALKKHKLDGINYLLCVATLEPRKNLNTLIDAYLLLPKTMRDNNKLVIVGGKGWLNKALMQRITELTQKGEIIALGYVSDNDLPHIYAAAYGFVLPSLYEGFGLPILEAMASAIPVLTSNASSLPEVAKGAAILTDAKDCKDIARGLKRLIEDDLWREKAVAKGLEIARYYTWQRCIENTIDIYKTQIPT